MRVLLLLLIAFVGWLLGSIRSAVLLGHWVFHRKVRTLRGPYPSLRECRKVMGLAGTALAVLLELGKAVGAVLLGGWLLGTVGAAEIGRLFGGFCLMMGSCFPIQYLFRGSKGLLCGLVTVFLVDWRAGLFCLAAFLICVVFTRFVSLSVVVAALLCPVFLWVFGHDGLSGLLALLCAVIILVQYRTHLVCLLNGTEPRLRSGRYGPRDEDTEN